MAGSVWASNLPVSHEASFKEAYNASEVTIKATGRGADDKATDIDLKRAAVWFILEGGTDPVLNTPESKTAFAPIAESFYDINNISKYVTWEAQKVDAQMKTADGLKRTKAIRINKGAIQADLSAKGVIKAVSDLRDALGNPTIMVIPECKTGESPIKVFDTNNLARHAAGVIESRLTAKQYDVIVPRGQDQLAQMTEMQGQLAEQDADPAYQLALTLGSDVYIVFSGMIENSKASVVVKAYETTTARLLGTETGYSKARPGANMEPLVEEAVSDAIDRVLQRITNYWTEDLKKGIQYKVIFKIDNTIGKAGVQDVQDEIGGVLDDNFKTKENIITDKTMDYNIWAKPSEFDKSSKIERFIRREVKGSKISKLNVNKKLIILKVEK
jgi:hypothetical protein